MTKVCSPSRSVCADCALTLLSNATGRPAALGLGGEIVRPEGRPKAETIVTKEILATRAAGLGVLFIPRLPGKGTVSGCFST